jgi:hypothetical protein
LRVEKLDKSPKLGVPWFATATVVLRICKEVLRTGLTLEDRK